MKSQEVKGIVTTAVATIVVGLRLFTKLKVARERLNLADYLNVAALITAWLFAIMLFLYDPWIEKMTAMGMDEEQKQQTSEQGFALFNAVTSIFFSLALTFARLAILVFYLRLSPILPFRWSVYTVIVFLCLYTGASILTSLLVFSVALREKINHADQALGMFYGIANIAVDICILILPLGVVLPLQMSAKRKVALLLLLGAGAFVCAISIYRVLTLTFISDDEHVVKSDAIARQLILSFAETNGAIICGCVPITARFFTQFLPEVLTCYRKLSTCPGYNTRSEGFSAYSTTVEKNRRRRDGRKVGRRANSASALRGSRDGMAHTEEYEMNQSYDSLERNVLGKGRADTTICAETQVFAPDQEHGITCIHDTRVSYGPQTIQVFN
ncbi:uncharacterized protein JN550_011301 [Neoarthrinium moseri]|uniref:uncharacterized protein n=1 Tax=Neoarthrinium moseri TaxID=1658444 RepID=UPI001FDC583D|nr:uncharacterized protein JN550_011301 [Neoarthrinium moseri]KAI1860839.1 hypothetical protein JN550_011301 [Neoarthrinium moseri]